MKNRINFVMGARKILSVNALYNAKMTWVNGRQVATIYKTGEAKQTEAYIREQVERLNVPVNYPWVNKETLFKMTIKVVFKSGYLSRDLDNCLVWGIINLRNAGRVILNQQSKFYNLGSTTMCRL